MSRGRDEYRAPRTGGASSKLVSHDGAPSDCASIQSLWACGISGLAETRPSILNKAIDVMKVKCCSSSLLQDAQPHIDRHAPQPRGRLLFAAVDPLDRIRCDP